MLVASDVKRVRYVELSAGCRFTEGVAGAGEDRGADHECCCEVNGIVASESVALGQLGGVGDEARGDLYEIKLADQLVEFGSRVCVLPAREVSAPGGCRQRSSRLDDDETSRSDNICGLPDRFGTIGTVLGDHQFDERRRVDVGDHLDDQRRCSVTRSLTGSRG